MSRNETAPLVAAPNPLALNAISYNPMIANSGCFYHHLQALYDFTPYLLPITSPLANKKDAGKLPHDGVCRELRGASWIAFRESPPTFDEVHRWAACGLNIGIITGQASGLVVLDVDDGQLPPGLELPHTPTVKTGRESGRGRHYYFRCDEQLTNKSPEGAGYELKARGQVIAPPSIHATGSAYSWLPGRSPVDVEVAPLPDAVKALFYADGSKKEEREQRERSEYILYPCSSLNKSEKEEPLNLDVLANDERVALAIMNVCGANVDNIGSAFCCPIHNEKNPSASLFRARLKNGTERIMFCDWHRGELRHTLPEVYAACVSGRGPEWFKSGQQVVWWIRALAHAGVINLPEVKPPRELPANAPMEARKVFNGYLLLRRCREVYQAGQSSTPLSWRFAATWCGGIGQNTIQQGIAWLLANDYLRVAPSNARCTCFTFGQATRRKKATTKQKAAEQRVEEQAATAVGSGELHIGSALDTAQERIGGGVPARPPPERKGEGT